MKHVKFTANLIRIIYALFESFTRSREQDAADLDSYAEVTTISTKSLMKNSEKNIDFAGNTTQKPILWKIGAGHTNKTPGKRSPVIPGLGKRFMEYEFNRKIYRLVAKELDALDIAYECLHKDLDGMADDLDKRVEKVNSTAINDDLDLMTKAYISIHANAGPAPSIDHWTPDSVHGIETWFRHGDMRSKDFASEFHKRLAEATGYRDRGLKSKSKGQFYVIEKTDKDIPVAFLELGFYNNKDQCKDLMTEKTQIAISEAIVDAIVFFEQNGLP